MGFNGDLNGMLRALNAFQLGNGGNVIEWSLGMMIPNEKKSHVPNHQPAKREKLPQGI